MSIRADNQVNPVLQKLQNPAVRDLAWSCFSPPLILCEELAPVDLAISNCRLPLDEQRQAWLEQLDREPGDLLRHIEKVRSNRLGLYFEALWHFFLEQDPRVELVAHNLPVRDRGKTLGEFDCIYYCTERQRHFHLELAVKFYLGQPLPSQTSEYSDYRQWIGPGTRDRLDIKLDRLLRHQLRLGEHPSAKMLLSKLNAGEMGLEMEVKGRLFQPLEYPLSPPRGYNPQLPLSPWVNSGEAVACHRDHLCAPLEKQHWLAPINALANLPAQAMDKLYSQQLRQLQRPQIIATVDAQGNEVERIFVTPEHWPEHLPWQT